MIEKAQDRHIRELEAAVKQLEDFNCDLDRDVESLKEKISSANSNIGELDDALAATDKLLAEIQQRVAKLENYTASQDQINEIHAWFAHLQQRVELCEQAQKGAIFCKPESIIGIVPTQPTQPTVDELHARIAYLEKELAAANAEANRAGYVEHKLQKRVNDLEEQLNLALSQTTRTPSVTEFKWVFHDDEQTSDLKKQISQLTYDNDILRKRIDDILNIAKKDT